MSPARSREPVAAVVEPLGGIANFGWVATNRLARGEQPYEARGGYAALRQAGITSVISLREATERENTVAGIPVPPYDVADEAEACRAHRLRFIHVPFLDRAILPIGDVAKALRAVDGELAAGEVVYIHCMAGIGRTGVLAAVWLLANGASGDEAAVHFLSYWLEFERRENAVLGPQESSILERYGFPLQWWTLQRLAEHFGTPIAGDYEGVRPQQPGDPTAWLADCARAMAPWRGMRRGTALQDADEGK